MTTATLQMFNALSQDMELQHSYVRDKSAVMRAFGLSPSEMATVIAGNISQIKKLLTGTEPLCFVLGLTRSSKGE